jgi:hypothetical protein
MLAFKDVQSTAKTTIEAFEVDAVTYFDGESVIADAGTSIAAIQSALGPANDGETAARGFVVIVAMPTGGAIIQQTAGVALVNASLVVWFLSNPDVNSASTGAQKDILEATQNGVAALLSYEDDSGDHFELTSVPKLIESNEGWHGYEVEFNKQVALS